jgi:HAD superfamily hydrolase (TIGR01509 family)
MSGGAASFTEHLTASRAFVCLPGGVRGSVTVPLGGTTLSDGGQSRILPWPEIVIFDCDGVLVDSEVIALGQTRRALGQVGLSLTHAQAMERFLGLSLDSIVQKAEADLAVDLPAHFRDDLTRDILASFQHDLKGVADVDKAVAGLECPVCVASSSSLERIRLSLAAVGYDRLFEPHVFSASMATRGKPHPDLFLYAARQMGADPAHCLVIEDSVPGIEAAVSAGMVAFGFVGGSHFSDLAQGIRLREAGASLIFDDMRRLPEIVSRRRSGDDGDSTEVV